jgi:hypothetical protein
MFTYPVQYLKQVTGENLLNVLLQKSPDYKTSQILPHLFSTLAENLASFGMGQGFYLQQDVTKKPVTIDIKCTLSNEISFLSYYS